jgi:porin
MTRLHVRHITVIVALLACPCVSDTADAQSTVAPGFEITSEVVVDAVALRTEAGSGAGVFLGKAALMLDVDTARAGLWNGGRARVSLIGTFGDDPSARTGDIQVVSNIAAPEGVRVLEAWIEQSVGKRVSVLAGYHDLNTEFDVVESAAELLNSSFGIGPEISQFGPSIFPSTHPALRVRWMAPGGTYFQAATYRGVPMGERRDGREWGGHLEVAEAGWSPGGTRLAAGAWRLSGNEPEGARRELTGYYVLGESTFQVGRRAVGVFARAGRTSAKCHPVYGYVGAGVRIGAPLASRPQDVLSFGTARADLSPEVQRSIGADAETTLELTWLVQVSDWLAIQPDLQYVDAPAAGGTSEHALVGAVRVIVAW